MLSSAVAIFRTNLGVQRAVFTRLGKLASMPDAASRTTTLNDIVSKARPPIAKDGPIKNAPRMGRPKATLFLTLTVLWVFPSFGAFLLVAFHDAAWRHADNVMAALGMIRLEQWIGLAILFAHVMFGWLAWHYRRHEPLQEIVTGDEPNPDHDPKKLS